MSWIKCTDCDDFWCTEHNVHVADCECPSLEEWLEINKDPYFIGEEDSCG